MLAVLKSSYRRIMRSSQMLLFHYLESIAVLCDEGNVFMKYKTKCASIVGCSERTVKYFMSVIIGQQGYLGLRNAILLTQDKQSCSNKS